MDISKSWTAQDLDQGVRLDRFLAVKLSGEGVSRALAARMIEQGWVQVNGQIMRKPAFKLNAGFSIACRNPETKKTAPAALELAVLYEDGSFAAVDKPAGLLTHPTSSLVFSDSAELASDLGVGKEPSVLQWIEGHIPRSSKVPRFGIVHRLDEATSGILLVAKTLKAYEKLVAMFQARQIYKTYLALAWGRPHPAEEVVRLRIARKYSSSGLRLFTHPDKGLEAETHYKLIQAYENFSLIELKPSTGRTHQLRLHLKAIGNPVCGDPVYRRLDGKHDPFKRLMLHAWKLELKHPISGKKLALEAPIPPDFRSEFERHTAKISFPL